MRVTTRGLEHLTTEQILVIYERMFGRLDPIGRGRILATASVHGWDRSWDSGLAMAA